MNECKRYSELISRLIDSDLSKAESDELNDHIRICDECRSLYNAFSEVSSFISDDLEDVPEDFSENVMASIKRDSLKTVRPLYKYKKIISLAVSAAAIIAVAVTVPNIALNRSSKNVEFMTASEPVLVSESYEADTYSTNSSITADFDDAVTNELFKENMETPSYSNYADTSAALAGRAAMAYIPADDLVSEVYAISSADQSAAVYALLTENSTVDDSISDPTALSDNFDICLSDPQCTVHVYSYGDAIIYSLDSSEQLYRFNAQTEELMDMISAP